MFACLHDCVIVFSQNRMSDTTDSTEQMQSTPDAGGRGKLVNDSRNATLLLPEGTGLEITLGDDGILPIQKTSWIQWLSASCSGWRLLSHCLPTSGRKYRTTWRKRWATRSTAKSDTLTTRSTWLAARREVQNGTTTMLAAVLSIWVLSWKRRAHLRNSVWCLKRFTFLMMRMSSITRCGCTMCGRCASMQT